MAEEYGIDRQRIYSFRRRGWSLEDAMQMCINDVRGRGRLFEYNGKLYRSPKALAEEYGLPWNSLAHYIQRCKTIEEAVDRCKETQEKKIMLWGKRYQSRYALAIAFGIRETSISARIHTRNMTLEEIILELLQKEPICFEGKTYNTLVELCAEYQVQPCNVFEKEEVDKSHLKEAIRHAEEQMQDEKYQDVIPVVREEYEEAYKNAKAIDEKPDATSEEVETAYKTLIEVGKKLTMYKGDLTELQAAYDLYAGKDLSIYTQDSKTVLEEALKEAEKVLKLGENAVKEDVNEALEKLNTAIEGLELIPADKSSLQEMVEKAAVCEAKIDEYTPETAEKFKTMLEEARKVLALESPSKEMIDSAYGALQQAISGLVLRADIYKDKLKALIEEAEKKDLSGYTKESVEELKKILLEAKAVLEDPSVGWEEAEQTLENLQKAIEGLKKSETDSPAEPDSGNTDIVNPDSSPSPSDAASVSNEKAVKTGDKETPIGWVTFGFAAMLAAAAGFLGRKKKH